MNFQGCRNGPILQGSSVLPLAKEEMEGVEWVEGYVLGGKTGIFKSRQGTEMTKLRGVAQGIGQSYCV